MVEDFVGIENRLYLSSSRPGATMEYCSTILVSKIMFVIIDGRVIG